MTRLPGRTTATALLLPFAFLAAACGAEDVSAPTSTSPPSTWIEVTSPVEGTRPDEPAVSTPKRFVDGDVCALLGEQEITDAAGTPYARRISAEPGERCTWQLGDTPDDNGQPVEVFFVHVQPADRWLGVEQGSVKGHPTRRQDRDGICMLRIALHQPGSGRSERAVMSVNLRLADRTADACPAAQSLAELVLDRLPAA
ncbi:hypothetical protein [Saccharothrix sp. HUAS TT1]|uniref:hypothetical protein n=1 Tax=unclassified Saccharothrix TaxID=2593673 RepID=UPI00345C2AB2